tara:strand:- start:584 stop:1009 length:426 start_codon:yes stop_codon:yes gene_type:complete
VPFLLLVHVTSAVALPKCPGIYDPNTWHNCKGTYEHEDAFRYVGEFKHGKYHGKGTSSRMAGDKYVGEWKDGSRHGNGAMLLVYGDIWVGQWKNDQWLSGEKYEKGEIPSDIIALFKIDSVSNGHIMNCYEDEQTGHIYCD